MPCTPCVLTGVSSPQCSVLPHHRHPEPWRPSSHFLPGRRLGPRLGRSLVCGAELRPDPSPVSPDPHGQNHPFWGEPPAGLQRQLPAEREQIHKGRLVKLLEFGLFLLDGVLSFCSPQELKVISVVEMVSVALEGDGSLYFPPTAVCSQSQRSHRIQNLSHLPLRFAGQVVLF